MHPEIEKLIELALADGQVTEKEREIILRKADSLGLDKDEVEMIWEAKKTLLEKNTIGTQIKCPACGARISGLSKTCICGYIFNTGSFIETKSLEASIESLENLIIEVRGLNSKSSKENIEILIGKVDKEIRFIKTRYADNSEVKKLLSELEVISNKYITQAVKKKKRRTVIVSIFAGFGILLYIYLFVKSRQIENEQSIDNLTFIAKCDSLQNPKLKDAIKIREMEYSYWKNFKETFFEYYPDYGQGYVQHLQSQFHFSEKTSYLIAENQLNKLQKKFNTPIDFVLYDERNNHRKLKETFFVDSNFISTLISKRRWLLKKELDSKLKLIQNSDLQLELSLMNDVDSTVQEMLLTWSPSIEEFILNEQNGYYPKQGYISLIMTAYRADEKSAKNFCEERLNFFKQKFKKPIDFFLYRDNVYYNNNPDQDDEQNGDLCLKKFNMK